MTVVEDIREQLMQLGLDPRGHKPTLKKRLRKHLKKDAKLKGNNASDDDGNDEDEPSKPKKSTGVKQQQQQQQEQEVSRNQKRLHKNSRYDYYLCFDVEATCELGFRFEFPSEVIEFPIVLLDGSTLEVVDEFHSYVRPIHRPILSDFCKELTGISQETIDNAPTFVEVLALFEEWLTSHGIILSGHDSTTTTAIAAQPLAKKSKKSKNNSGRGNSGNSSKLHVADAVNDFQYGATYCFITDGPFDIRDFISKQCLHSNILRPSYFAHPYIDVRTMFRDYFDLIQWKNLERMLSFLGATFEGRQHSGICDARMVALIAKRLAEGFRKNKNDPIFQEDNTELVAPQWSDEKVEKFKDGCVLKANRSTNNTFIKMISFKKVAQIEGLPSAIAAGKAAPPLTPKLLAGFQDSKGEDGEGTDNVSAANTFSLPSPAKSAPASPTAETFVSESMFSALSLNSE